MRSGRLHSFGAFARALAVASALGGVLAAVACSSADDIPPDDELPDAGRAADASAPDVTLGEADATPAPAADSAVAADTAAPDASGNGDAGSVDAPDAADASAPDATFVEAPLAVVIAMKLVARDAGAPTFDDAGNPLDAGATSTATLTITTRDGTTPIFTDLWLYTLDESGQKTPLTAFTSTAARKAPRLMMPATIGGKPSGLTPADDGVLNGLMSSASRGVMNQGAFVPTMNGTVVVTLAALPTSPILVIAAVEDQRYAGAAVINPDGTPGILPGGIGVPETHVLRSFQDEVKPLLRKNCDSCHKPTDLYEGSFYLVTGSRDDLVNDNYALTEQKAKCALANPDGGQPLAACVQAITQAQFLVEPGAPAASDLLTRSRPDENAGTSQLGLAWYGSKGSRYNATYGDRRMPSTAETEDAGAWTNGPTPFDDSPGDFQVLFDWVAQGARP